MMRKLFGSHHHHNTNYYNPLVIFLTSTFLILIFAICPGSEASSTRCFICRSRGGLGHCKDPFPYNETSFKDAPGDPINVTPCPSGWCRKLTEGVRGPSDEFGEATDRSCLSYPPNDGEERCAEVKIRNQISQLCLCRGDLCNGGSSLRISQPLLISSLGLGLALFIMKSWKLLG